MEGQEISTDEMFARHNWLLSSNVLLRMMFTYKQILVI